MHARSADVARSFLASQMEVIDERTQLFQDLLQMAMEKLEMLEREDRTPAIKAAGELRAYWPAMRPAA